MRSSDLSGTLRLGKARGVKINEAIEVHRTEQISGQTELGITGKGT